VTIRDFMATFGPVSSAFDFLTFGVLLFVVHATVPAFRTGWFLVSVVTELAIVFVIRTRRPFYRSAPSRVLLGASGLVALVALALPFTPLGALFRFAPLPIGVLGPLLAVVAGYVLVTEGVKRSFFRRIDRVRAD
jgi:Mg2+-importing ATPase